MKMKEKMNLNFVCWRCRTGFRFSFNFPNMYLVRYSTHSVHLQFLFGKSSSTWWPLSDIYGLQWKLIHFQLSVLLNWSHYWQNTDIL